MDVRLFRLEVFVSARGNRPFNDWLDGLRDGQAAEIIDKRLARLENGNLGDCKFFDSIIELRIDHGPGYRIYCARKEKAILLLLIGGAKRTQAGDIKTALEYWREYQARTPGKRAV
ncbi:MAG TPA: type II toxin-antitoxin system RelE/ParE family toxin [Fibrobacteria bacterium]|nr:type II toxin-antitoxin system RelE/ParE family toxin [Fibrobacteria bacterium]